MEILVACEESQAVTIELRKLGHEAYSCDIEECSGGYPEWHIQDDVLPLLDGNCEFKTVDGNQHKIDGKWDMIIAFPPCTYLSNVGAPHTFKSGVLQQERYEKGLKAKEFFMNIYNSNCDKMAIENPTPMTIFELPIKTQVIQPWQFGHPFQKRTQLWLKGLPMLEPTKIMEEREPTTKPGNWYNKGGKDRQKNRSKTFEGIAKAMAKQWTKGEICKISNFGGKKHATMGTCKKCGTYADINNYNLGECGTIGSICNSCLKTTDEWKLYEKVLERYKEERLPEYEAWRTKMGAK